MPKQYRQLENGANVFNGQHLFRRITCFSPRKPLRPIVKDK